MRRKATTTLKSAAGSKAVITRTIAIAMLALLAHSACAEPVFDVVLKDGRVMDPVSGLDAVRNVGIINGKIAAISASGLSGSDVVDASGMVIASIFTRTGRTTRPIGFRRTTG